MATVSAEKRGSQQAATTVDVPSPYLLFLGDTTDGPYAKTAFGLRDWAPEKCVGEFALPAATVTTGMSPFLSTCL